MKKKLFISNLICLLMLFCSTNVFASDINISALNGAQPLTDQQESRISVSTIETSGTTVTISNAAGLKAFRDRVNSGETTLNATLTADIDLGNQNWTPIGTGSYPYSGTFDGSGYAIEGLYVAPSGDADAGLFGKTNGAYIQDLGVLGSVQGGGYSGGIVARAVNTYITNCYNDCDVSGVDCQGGIVGYLSATYDAAVDSSTNGKSSLIICCYNAGDITTTCSSVTSAGGITGVTKGYVTIANCYNWGNIYSPKGLGGGIAGIIQKDTFIANSYNMGEPNNVETYGEIVGWATGNGGVANSYYLKTGYASIGLNQSTYSHTIYYYNDYYSMTTQYFVDLLNNGDEYFTFDKYYINYGLPVLNWEQPYSLFDDVSINDWFIAPVNWAVLNDVTYGTSDTQFSPNNVCTRAQTVTFLWRAAGSPEPTIGFNPFTDVSSGSYYYKAVLWAEENGITAGTSATTFSPEETVSRAQVVTFLWRTNGSPSMSVTNPFTDTANAYYYNAVLWAVGNGITYGTSTTTFSPNSGCTRAQIASFLYRFFVL